MNEKISVTMEQVLELMLAAWTHGAGEFSGCIVDVLGDEYDWEDPGYEVMKQLMPEAEAMIKAAESAK